MSLLNKIDYVTKKKKKKKGLSHKIWREESPPCMVKHCF